MTRKGRFPDVGHQSVLVARMVTRKCTTAAEAAAACGDYVKRRLLEQPDHYCRDLAIIAAMYGFDALEARP